MDALNGLVAECFVDVGGASKSAFYKGFWGYDVTRPAVSEGGPQDKQ